MDELYRFQAAAGFVCLPRYSKRREFDTTFWRQVVHCLLRFYALGFLLAKVSLGRWQTCFGIWK